MKGDVKLKIHVDDFDELWLNEVVVEVDNPHYDDGELEPVVLNRLLFKTKQALSQKPPFIGKFLLFDKTNSIYDLLKYYYKYLVITYYSFGYLKLFIFFLQVIFALM